MDFRFQGQHVVLYIVNILKILAPCFHTQGIFIHKRMHSLALLNTVRIFMSILMSNIYVHNDTDYD